MMKLKRILTALIIITIALYTTGLRSEKKKKSKNKRRNFKSLVPKFTFASTLKEQEAQLRTNPLLMRFKESRERMKNDPHLPLYHFTAPENRLNDPNGLCFWKGNWHLFYQGYPPEDPRQHWGHAVSKDLIHWQDLPYAIYPDPERACYSGSTFVEKDRVIAMYHGTTVGNMVAISKDPLLLNWKKVTGKAVIPMRNPDGSKPPYNVFDPCIWKKEGVYYSLSGGTLPLGPGKKNIRANFLFRSKDLANWEYMHPFVEKDMYSRVGDDGACPYFWPFGDQHIMLHYSHTTGGKYLLGDYDTKRDKFVVTSGGYFNFGPSAPAGVHAPSAAPDGNGNVIVIFNMNPAYKTRGWDQIMTLPRLLKPNKKDRLNDFEMEPAGDIESLRYDHQQVKEMTLPANKEVVLKKIKGNAMEIIAEIKAKNVPMVEMNVLRSPGREEVTRIMIYPNRGYRHREIRGRHSKLFNSIISIDSSYSSTLPDALSRAPETAQFYIKKNKNLKLRVFIDKSVVEVYINGHQCVAMRVYPGRKDSLGISLRSQGKDLKLISLDAWQMKNIYED